MQRQLILGIYVPTLLLAFCTGLLTPILPIFVRDEFVGSYGMIGLVLAAGALGIPYKIFLSAVTLGRFIRFALLFWGAMGLTRL